MKDCERNTKLILEIAGLKDKTKIIEKLAEMEQHANKCSSCMAVLEEFQEGLEGILEFSPEKVSIKDKLRKLMEKVKAIFVPLPSFQYSFITVKDATEPRREIITLLKTEKQGFKIVVSGEKKKREWDIRISIYKKGISLKGIGVEVIKGERKIFSGESDENGIVYFKNISQKALNELENKGVLKILPN